MDRTGRKTGGIGASTSRLTGAIAGVALLALAAAPAVGQAPEAAARPDPAQDAAQLELGRAIAVRDCSSCHAIGLVGSSPLREAPKFRDLHKRFDVGDLSEALAEGIVVGHGPMPVWVYEPREVDALIGYLKSLEPAQEP